MSSNQTSPIIQRRQVFREEIRNAIKDAIFSGRLQPGDRIIETFWAKELGVSQGPVREAIRDLEASGLVETIPFKGSRVRVMTEKDIHDNYGVRLCLESHSIRNAIELISDAEMDKLVEQLNDTLLAMQKSAQTADLQRFTECDTQFHRAIINATDNQVLLRLWEQCNMRNWFLFSSLTDTQSLERILSDHIQICAAIQNRDSHAATCILEHHLKEMMHGFIQNG